MIRILLAALLTLLAASAVWAENGAENAVRRGEVSFSPASSEESTPERFRLAAHRFAFEQTAAETVADKIEISTVTFPSPVETPHKNNNTVHCEYFRPVSTAGVPVLTAGAPVKPGKYPAVVILHILGGDFDLCRLFGRTFAHHGVCALFLKLPYYGPRSEPGVRSRMVTIDPRETAEGMRQGVLDIRRAAAWLSAQEEVDENRLGIFGISLGGITAALAATAEPRFTSAALMLAGGDIGAVSWDINEREAVRAREFWLSQGKTREEFIALLKPIDPVQYGEKMRGRRVLMINASFDEVIPKVCTESLWKSFGEPKIVWFDCGHYSAARFMFDALASVTEFFNEQSAP